MISCGYRMGLGRGDTKRDSSHARLTIFHLSWEGGEWNYPNSTADARSSRS
jgi:hypothetical protein